MGRRQAARMHREIGVGFDLLGEFAGSGAEGDDGFAV